MILEQVRGRDAFRLVALGTVPQIEQNFLRSRLLEGFDLGCDLLGGSIAVALCSREIPPNRYETVLGEFDLANVEYTSSDPEMKRLVEMSTHIG